ncbi:MAG TPA: hypothetical protein VGL72_03330 [Bryobacteraceae bacterium]
MRENITDHPESAARLDSIRFEIGVVNCENRRQGFPPGEVDESGVSEVHGPVPVARHQRMNLREFGMPDRCEFDRAGVDELPGAFHFRAVVANEAKKLG